MKPVTDPNLIAQLNQPQLTPVQDPALLQQLNTKEAGLLEAPGIKLGQAGETVMTGATMAGVGASKFIEDGLSMLSMGKIKFNPLVEMIKARNNLKTDEEALNLIFSSMEGVNKQTKDFWNPENKQLGLGGEIAGSLATLPMQLGAMPFAAADRGKQMLEMGESVERAQAATGIDAAVNAAGFALPAATPVKEAWGLGKRTLAKGTSGAAINMMLGAGSDQFAKDISKGEMAKQALDPFTEEGMKRRAVEGVLGFGLGALSPSTVVRTKGRHVDVVLDRLDDKVPETVIPEDSLPKVDFSELGPRVPELPPIEGETPLPGIRGIADEVPLLPDTPIAREGVQGETPLPDISEALSRAKLQGLDPAASGNLLGFAPEVPFDSGHRPVGTDGTPLRGMAEDVPTVDFQLRQEALDTDAFRQMTDFAADHLDQMRAQIDNKWKEIEKQSTFLSEYEGSKGARELEDANLLKQLDELHVLQEQAAAMEQGILSVYKDFGIERAQDAFARSLYERMSPERGIQPQKTNTPNPDSLQRAKDSSIASQVDDAISRGEIDPKNRDSEIARRALRKKQGGAIDPQVFKEGMKRMLRSLSKLTDQPWVRAKYPSDKFMTNSDGTPLIMLHGTTNAFDEFNNRSSQGIHAGFIVPSHLIRAGLAYTQPNKSRKFADALNKKNPGMDPAAAFPGVMKPTGFGINIRPLVIRKGKYPFVNMDGGNWDPLRMMTDGERFAYDPVTMKDLTLREFLTNEGKKNGAEPMTYNRWAWYERMIAQSDSQQRNRLFQGLLSEFGVDGFFYRNQYESLNRTGAERGRYGNIALKTNALQDPISFVTWDPNRVESLYSKRTPVPASQRGGAKGTWDPGKIREALKEKIHNLGKPKFSEMEEEAVNAFNKISHMRDKGETVWKNIAGGEVDMIRPDTPVESVIKAAKDADDITSWRAFSSGLLSKAETSASVALKEVYHWWDNAIKRTERWDRDWVRPAADAFQIVFRDTDDVIILKKIFDKELKRKAPYTNEELRTAGVPEESIVAYNNLRHAFDKAIDLVNEVRLAKGRKPITPLEAYQSARWRGPWRATVTDAEGKILWQVHETTRWGANKAAAYLKHHFPDLNVSDVSYKSNNARANRDLQAGYLEMLELLDKDDARVLAIKQLMEDSASMETVNLLGTEKHFKKKTGVRGFTGDRPWADQGKDAKAFFVEQLQYVKNTFEWAEKQKAAENTKKLLSDPDVAKKKNFTEVVREYSKHQTGIGSKQWIDGLENNVAEWMGISPAHLDKTLGTGKSFFYITKLGFLNIPFSISQLVQPVFTAPYHSKLSAEYSHNAVETIASSMKHGNLYVLMHLTKEHPKISDGFFNKMSPVMKEAALYAEQNAVVDINPLTDIRDLQLPKAWERVQHYAGWNIRQTEMLARSTAFFSFVSHLDQSGKFANTPEGRLKMFQMAEDATKFTMVDYRPSERAMFFQRFGLFGNALSTLQTFKLNQMNQMVTYVDQLRSGNPVPALQFFGAYLMLGGASGFMALDDIDALWKLLLKAVPSEQYAKLPEWAKMGPKGAIIQNIPDYVAFGGVSKLTGVDLYRRFNSSDITPIDPDGLDQSLASAFPWIADLYKQGKGVFQLFSDNKAEQMAGMYAVTPTSMRGALEENLPGWVSPNGVAPQSTDPSRGVYTRDPNHKVLFGAANERSIRNLGMRSLKEAATRDKDFQIDRVNREHEERRTDIAKTVRQNIILGTTQNLERKLQTYAKLGGDPNTLFDQAQLDEAFFQKHTDKFQKLQAAANDRNLPAVSELIRYAKAQGLIQQKHVQ